MDTQAPALDTLINIEAEASEAGQDTFSAQSHYMPGGRIYGGQVLAQAILGASRTVTDDRLIHSMHGYFLRPGSTDQPHSVGVERIHDGRSFSTRRAQAYQNGAPIFSMIASFQVAGPGLDHAVPMPDVPMPEDLPTMDSIIDPLARSWAQGRPIEVRYASESIFTPGIEKSPTQALWLRAKAPLPDDELIHRAALAYVSDFTILEPTLRAHGLTWTTPGLKFASLDHAMWWHRPARVDEWLLFAQESTSATSGRGLTQGRFYTREGELVASVAQEGMVRVPSELLDEA